MQGSLRSRYWKLRDIRMNESQNLILAVLCGSPHEPPCEWTIEDGDCKRIGGWQNIGRVVQHTSIRINRKASEPRHLLPCNFRLVELAHIVAGTEFPIVPPLILAFDQRLLERQEVIVDRRIGFLEDLLGLPSGIGPGPVSVFARCDGDEKRIAFTASPSARIPTPE